MIDISKHLINLNEAASTSMKQLNDLGKDLTLFVINEDQLLVGTLTDGDIRRGLLKNLSLHDKVELFMNPYFSHLIKKEFTLDDLDKIKSKEIDLLPILDHNGRIVKIVNLNETVSILPVDAVIMAGGEGRRLRPLTEVTPKPLLKVGSKPILEHNLDRLIRYGIDDYWICVRYLGDQIESYFGNGSAKNVSINYVWEDKPYGTIGGINQISGFKHDHILITNSDILTNLDFENFYLDFIKKNADLSIVTIPYSVNVPYAVLETSNGHVLSFKEKPTYTYYSNGGIYLLKREMLKYITPGFYNATDLMEELIAKSHKVISFPLHGYWLDIGRQEDYKKAQEDVNHVKF